MEFWEKVMKGRCGIDNLNMGLLLLVLVLNMLTKIFWLPVLSVISLFVLCFGLYRTFSKRLERRKKEDEWFTRQVKKIAGLFKKDQ